MKEMLRKLIRRPIAVTLTVTALAVICLLSLRGLPVSLMPDIDVPRITVNIPMTGASVREAEANGAAPLRGQLMQVAGVRQIRSEAKSGGATITMEFTPGARMDLAFIEVNEKVDRAMSLLPEGMERPKVVKAGSMDIPAFYLDIYLADDSGEGFSRLSDYVTGVVCKRLEQLPETALTDISGDTRNEIAVEPDPEKCAALGITSEDIGKAIVGADLRLESLSVADGAYRYSLHFDSQVADAGDIREVLLTHEGRMLRLGDICRVTERVRSGGGIVRHGDARAVTIAIIKQNDARMEDLRKNIDSLLEELRAENPGVEFTLTRDQTRLLSYSIDNLTWNLLLGILLASLVLFLFMGSAKASVLVMVSIPLSLMLTLFGFKLAGISINVVSLAGLVLGVGMMVDNSIIVIDNIARLRKEGMEEDEAVARGASEVFTPMLSSVLTTCSVFVPLIFLSGTAGAIFYDQAMAVTISLFSSLAVAILVIPVYYRVMKVRPSAGKEAPKGLRLYERVLTGVLTHKLAALSVMAGVMVLGIVCGSELRKERMPDVTHTDMLITVDWNSGISAEANDRRMEELYRLISPQAATVTTMAGSQGFILPHTKDLSPSESVMYVSADSEERIGEIRRATEEFLSARYPEATAEFSVSGNVYEMLFPTDASDLEIRLQTATGHLPDPAKGRDVRDSLAVLFPEVAIPKVQTEENLLYAADREAVALRGVSYRQLYERVRGLAGGSVVHSVSDGSGAVPVTVGEGTGHREDLLGSSIRTADGLEIPLSSLLSERRTEDYKRLYASSSGPYLPIGVNADDKTVEEIRETVKGMVAKPESGLSASFAGAYYESRELIGELAVVLAVAVGLLYLILAAQFESLVQPLIILSEVAVDIAFVFIAMWLAGESVNLMSMIGIVVMCGIIINDSILKVDTINRLRKGGMPTEKAIHEGGRQRLNPIIMTSLTTILAIAPFLRRGDLGSDLQFPLSFTLIVGMAFGTLVSLFAIPMLYEIVYGEKKKK